MTDNTLMTLVVILPSVLGFASNRLWFHTSSISVLSITYIYGTVKATQEPESAMYSHTIPCVDNSNKSISVTVCHFVFNNIDIWTNIRSARPLVGASLCDIIYGNRRWDIDIIWRRSLEIIAISHRGNHRRLSYMTVETTLLPFTGWLSR